jgi:hypothetical protein
VVAVCELKFQNRIVPSAEYVTKEFAGSFDTEEAVSIPQMHAEWLRKERYLPTLCTSEKSQIKMERFE